MMLTFKILKAELQQIEGILCQLYRHYAKLQLYLLEVRCWAGNYFIRSSRQACLLSLCLYSKQLSVKFRISKVVSPYSLSTCIL